MLLTIINLLFQYCYGSGTQLRRDRDVQGFVIVLGIELIFFITGLLIGYHYGIYLCVIGGLIGFLAPLAMYKMYQPSQVNFPHLVERLSLIIIITFGETLVNITQYFNGAIYSPLPIIIFAGVAALFGVYTLLVERFLNHHQHIRGFVAMYTHIIMIISLLSITAGIIYLKNDQASRTFISLFIAGSLIVFYLCLCIYSCYNQRHLQFSNYDFAVMIGVLCLGVIGIFLQKNSNLGLMTAFASANIIEFGLMEWRLHHLLK